MQTVTLSGQFDGKKIVLDEPFEFGPNTRLLITVLSAQICNDEREGWLLLSKAGLENAYGADEVEYSLDLIKEPNPDYEGR